MMAQVTRIVAVLYGFLLLSAATHAQADASSLVSRLTSSLGVTESQAAGGAGAIFKYAKSRLSPDDFGQVASAVPGIDSLMKAAPSAESSGSGGVTGAVGSMLGGSDGALGGITGALGGSGGTVSGVGGALGDLSALAGPFSKLGMSPDMIGKFVPVVLDYVKSTGGSGVMSVLKGALM
jgi:hypothetical protein